MDNFLSDMSIYSVLLPLLTGLVLLRFQDANARIMIILLAFASISQIGSKFLEVDRKIFYNSYILVDTLFWSLLFFRNTKAKYARMLILMLCLSLVTLSITVFIHNGISKAFYSYLVCFDNTIQLICVLIYFFERYTYETFTRLTDDSMFWFCIGILFYAPCTYFLFAYRWIKGSYLDELWNYHHILNTLLYLIITIGFLVNVKKVRLLLPWI